MNFINRQKNILVKTQRERKVNLAVFGARPFSDWRIILSTFFVLLIVVGFLSYSNYKNLTTISSDVIFPNQNVKPVVDLKKVDKIISDFEKKTLTDL